MWKVKKSKIHGTGVFATTNINKGQRVIEYVGRKVLKSEGDKISENRIKKYLNSKKTGSVYVFELNNRYDIDGSPLYNKARYINHSCSPNCEVDIIRGRIWISSIKKIKDGDELSYDYGYDFDENYEDHVCKCGSKNCIGYIIAKDERYKYKRILKKRKNVKRRQS